jgi:hypothetical protein
MPVCSRASGSKQRHSRGGRITGPGTGADPRARIRGGSGQAPHCRSLHGGTGAIRTCWSGLPTGRRVGGCGTRIWYIPVRSVAWDRAESAERGRQRPPACWRIAAGQPGLPSRCRAGAGVSKPLSQPGLPVLSWMSWRTRRPGRRRQTASDPCRPGLHCAGAPGQSRAQRRPSRRAAQSSQHVPPEQMTRPRGVPPQ